MTRVPVGVARSIKSAVVEHKVSSEVSIEIPMERLSEELLLSVIEEFVLREGTDYGHQDWSLERKIDQVKKQIKAQMVKVAFDPETETCTLVKRY